MPLSVTTGQNCTSGSSNLPTTPTLTATSNYAYTNIPLSWTVSTVSNGCTLAGYHLYRVGTTSPIYTGTAANFTDTGVGLSPANLNSGTAYSYYVQAYDSGGNVSANSTTVSATTEVDNVAPTEPTGLTGNATSSSSISLSWNPSTDLPNPGGVGLTGYYIYRNNATTPTYTVTAPTTTFVDSNVNPSTTYQYAVTAFDKNNNVSAETANVSVTTPAAPLNCTSSSSAPSAPTNLTSPSQTMTTIGLSWSASAPGSGSNCTITGYQIYRAGNLVNTVTSGTTYTDTGLLPSTSYAYMVVAVESNGKQSAAANLTQETAPDTQPPTQPTNFTAVANSPTQVALSWTASTDLFGVTGYILTREHTGSANVVTNLGSTVTSYIDNTVSTSTAYTYTLVAFDAAGNDSTAASTTLTTPAPTCSSNPSAASGLNSSAETSTSVSLSWTASTPAANCSIKGYEIFRGSTDETPNLVTTTSYTNTGLTAYTSYSYTIVAVDSSGHTSAASSALSVTTLTSTGCTTVLIADVLRQCSVNFNDLAAFATDYPKYDVTGVTVQPDTDGDLNDDGLVNFGDLALFAQYYPLENGQ
jgi:chitodextrinase